jgi:hypothetical protein
MGSRVYALNMKHEKSYVLWLAGTVIGALALVGLVSALNVNKTPPLRTLVSTGGEAGGPQSGQQDGTPMAKGDKCKGNKITTADGTNLCISNQPFAGDPEVKSEPAVTEIQDASHQITPGTTHRFTTVAPSDKPCQSRTGVTI